MQHFALFICYFTKVLYSFSRHIRQRQCYAMTTATNHSAGSPLSRFRSGQPAPANTPATAQPPKFIREQLAMPATKRMLDYAEIMYGKISRAIPPSVQIPAELLGNTADLESAWNAGDFEAFSRAMIRYTVAVWEWFKATPEGKKLDSQRSGG